MDINILGEKSLKIKTKKTTLAIDPLPSIQKFDADCVILADKNSDVNRINNYRIVIKGIGEYEVSGLKIYGIKDNGEEMYVLTSDNVSTLITKSSSLEKISADKVGEYEIALIFVDGELNQSVVTAMEPRIVILYGPKAKEGAKILGKENASSSSKISLSEDKLPEEMDVLVLG